MEDISIMRNILWKRSIYTETIKRIRSKILRNRILFPAIKRNLYLFMQNMNEMIKADRKKRDA